MECCTSPLYSAGTNRRVFIYCITIFSKNYLSKTCTIIKCKNNLYYILPQDSIPGMKIIIASGIYFLVSKEYVNNSISFIILTIRIFIIS